MRFLFIPLTVFFFVACNNGKIKVEQPAQSLSDSLLNQVLEGHDVAMPQMFKLERLQKDTKSKVDSLNKLKNANADKLASLNETLRRLNHADSSMHAWMGGFKYDSLKENESQREVYLQAQLSSVNKMKDSVLATITYADSVLKN